MNSINNIPKSLLEIVFQNRNKAYGAYELRTHYASRLGRAMAIVFSVAGLFIFYSLTAKSTADNGAIDQVDDVITFVDLSKEIPEIELPKIEPVEPVQQATSTAATEKFVTPLVVPDEQFVEEDRPPTTDDLANKKIATFTTEGTDDDGALEPPSVIKEKGIGPGIETIVKPDDLDDVIVTHVNIEAQYPGGLPEWRRFLERNLDYPDEAEEAGIFGDVWVQFIVDKDGNVSEVQALNNPGGGLADEAMRIIKKSKKWKPAELNGRKVTYRQKQKISFRIH